MAALTTAEATRLVAASLGETSYTNPTTPMKLALATSASSASAAGTEVTGGSYARQNIVFASGANTGVVTFTNMPACTVTHIDIYDSNGTPRRCWWAALTASKTLASGDSISFAISAVTAAMA